MYLPAGNLVQRVLMLGGPQDCKNYCDYNAYSDYFTTVKGVSTLNHVPIPAAWVSSNSSGISSSAFRGLRHGYAADNLPSTTPATPLGFTDEMSYGNNVAPAWAKMNIQGVGTGSVKNLDNDTVNETILDDGQCLLYPTFPLYSKGASGTKCTISTSNPSHRFVITQPETTYNPVLSSLFSHDATAANPYLDLSILDPNVAYVWDQMLLGN
jgi:hypothetical protein